MGKTSGVVVLFVALIAPSSSLASSIDATDLTLSKTHNGTFTQGQMAAKYSIVVRNNGGVASSGPITVTDTVPTGLTATKIDGAGWNCNLSALTCTRSDSLAAGASFSDIALEVTVNSDAPATVTNTANVSGGGDSYAPNNTAEDSTTVNPGAGLIAPTNLVATATSTTSVALTWDAVASASSYRVYRWLVVNGVPALAGTPTTTSFTDTVAADTTYIYVVSSSDGSNQSGGSNTAIATTIMFTNDPLTAGVTKVQSAHVTELRRAVNMVRVAANLNPYPFTGTATGPIRAIDIFELREALDEPHAIIRFSIAQYTNPGLDVGSPVMAADVQELREAVR